MECYELGCGEVERWRGVEWFGVGWSRDLT